MTDSLDTTTVSTVQQTIEQPGLFVVMRCRATCHGENIQKNNITQPTLIDVVICQAF